MKWPFFISEIWEDTLGKNPNDFNHLAFGMESAPYLCSMRNVRTTTNTATEPQGGSEAVRDADNASTTVETIDGAIAATAATSESGAALSEKRGNTMEATLRDQIELARNRGASLVAITTADQPAAAQLCADVVNGSAAAVGWDTVRGPHSLNSAGEMVVGQLCSAAGNMEPWQLTTWADLSLVAPSAADESLLVAYNAHLLFESANADSMRNVQGLMNLRDVLGSKGVTLVLLCSSWPSPVEMGSDVLVLDDPLPTADERREMISDLLAGAMEQGCKIADVDAAVSDAVIATKGLSRYAAEQTVSLSLRDEGLDREQLRQRMIEAINSTPGLEYLPPDKGRADIGGLDSFVEELTELSEARDKPGMVVFVDEIEKDLMGSTGANDSGVSARTLKALLEYMNNEGASGIIACGPGGSGKSLCAQVASSILGVPTAKVDIGSLFSSGVGDSERNTRALISTLKRLAGSTYWIGACNSLNGQALPPELLRRFTEGTWFFDLPSPEERDAIWQVHRRRFGIDADEANPTGEGYSGANIASVCRRAWARRTTLEKAARKEIPAAVRHRDQVESLRRQAASDAWISATTGEPYTGSKGEAAQTAEPTPKRAMRFSAPKGAN